MTGQRAGSAKVPAGPWSMATAQAFDQLMKDKGNALFYLSREAMKRHQMDELWKAQAATSPKSIARIVLSDKLVEEIRKELRRQTGHQAEASRIVSVLRTEVFRPEAL